MAHPEKRRGADARAVLGPLLGLLAASAIVVGLLWVSHAALGSGPEYQVAQIIGAIVLMVCLVLAFRRILAASERGLSNRDA
ncbi:hypothetical protein ABEG17_01715 [Pedococcus sp. KACC 23699]|uniref:Uncharacterized protein n=1 Tax=Pedococcus sp. KACC 23699 TaxID=3149228 RepID=A0AAU7JUT1_9MICO